jgi:hypothetical protein
MPETISSKPQANTATIGRLFGSALIQGGELWMNTHKELLASIGAMLEDWLLLNRAALDASSRTLQKLHASPSLAELFQLPQEWASEYWRWTVTTASVATEDSIRVTRSLAAHAREAARTDIQVKPEPVSPPAAEAVAAAE